MMPATIQADPEAISNQLVECLTRFTRRLNVRKEVTKLYNTLLKRS